MPQLTAVSDHKSSETHRSVAAGRWFDSPGGISWAGLSWAARPFLQKAFFSLKKNSLGALEASAVTRVSSHILTPCLPRASHFACADIWGPSGLQWPRSVGGRVSEAFHLLLRLEWAVLELALCYSWRQLRWEVSNPRGPV